MSFQKVEIREMDFRERHSHQKESQSNLLKLQPQMGGKIQ